MKKQPFLLLAILFCMSGIGIAQSTITLEDALSTALEKNYNIKLARNNAEISKNNATAGNAGLLPKVDLSSSASYNRGNNLSLKEQGIDGNSSINAGIGMTYTLFDGLGNVMNFKKLKTQAEYGQLSSRNNIETTIMQVVNAYFQAAFAYEQLQINQETFDISKERLERSKTNKEFGNSSTLDVLNAKVDLNRDSLNFANAFIDFNEQKRNLSVLLGNEAATDFMVDLNISDFQQFDIDQLSKDAKIHNASMNMMRNQLEQSSLDLKIANAAKSPILSLSAQYGYSQFNYELDLAMHDPNPAMQTRVSLSFNVFDGNRRNIAVQNAKIAIDNSQFQLKNQELELEKNIGNTYASYMNSLNTLNQEMDNLQSAELNFEQTKELFLMGQITSTQFREAQLNLIRSKSNIAQAKYSAKLIEFELVRLSGKLTE